MKHCFAEIDDLSFVGNERNDTSEINIPGTLSFSVISPVIMQLVYHSLFFVCQTLSL